MSPPAPTIERNGEIGLDPVSWTPHGWGGLERPRCRKVIGIIRRSSGGGWVRWFVKDSEELAQQFEPSAQAIRNWAKQVALDAGQRMDSLTTEDGRN